MNHSKIKILPLIMLLTACAPKQQPELTLSGSRSDQATTETAPSIPSTTKPTQPGKTVQTKSITSWALSGAMAARNKNKAWSASVNWAQQGPDRYQIRLFGPLGGGTVLIEKSGKVISFKDGPKQVTSTNAEQLLQDQTGIRLPVRNLYYWVRGLPAPEAIQAEKYDENHHLVALKQGGYSIVYTHYTSVNQTALPSKITLQGHGMLIKFVIKNWKI